MNAILSTWMRLPSFIVTLGTMSIFTGITLHLLGGKALLLPISPFTELASKQTIEYVPDVMLVAIGLWAALEIGVGALLGTLSAARGRRRLGP